MNSLRKVFGSLIAVVMLAAFALPVNAASPGKTITLTLPDPNTLTTSTTQFAVKINNTGNSNANSFEIEWPTSAYFTVSSATAGGTTVTPTTGLQGSGYQRVLFLQQLPTKTSVTITLAVTVASTGCASSSVEWTAFAWTGAPGPTSQSFSLQGGPYKTPLPTAASCTIGFDNKPADAFTGSTITTVPFDSTGAKVRVRLLADGSPSAGVSVDVSSTACSISGSATTDSDGYATFTTLKSTATTDVDGCVLSASASGYTPNPATSDSFNVKKPAGTLGCTSSNNYAHGTATGFSGTTNYDPNTSGPFTGTPGWGLRRGLNTTGDCPYEIPFTFTFDGTTAGFVADKLGQSIIVEYVLVAPTSSTTNGWPPVRRSKFAWGLGLHNPPLSGEYIDALACNNDDISGASGSPLPTIPASVANGSFTQYQTGATAQMCASQQGWTSISTGVVQFWLRVIDTDGWSQP